MTIKFVKTRTLVLRDIDYNDQELCVYARDEGKARQRRADDRGFVHLQWLVTNRLTLAIILILILIIRYI
jgi:hypothetical protein